MIDKHNRINRLEKVKEIEKLINIEKHIIYKNIINEIKFNKKQIKISNKRKLLSDQLDIITNSWQDALLETGKANRSAKHEIIKYNNELKQKEIDSYIKSNNIINRELIARNNIYNERKLNDEKVLKQKQLQTIVKDISLSNREDANLLHHSKILKQTKLSKENELNNQLLSNQPKEFIINKVRQSAVNIEDRKPIRITAKVIRHGANSYTDPLVINNDDIFTYNNTIKRLYNKVLSELINTFKAKKRAKLANQLEITKKHINTFEDDLALLDTKDKSNDRSNRIRNAKQINSIPPSNHIIKSFEEIFIPSNQSKPNLPYKIIDKHIDSNRSNVDDYEDRLSVSIRSEDSLNIFKDFQESSKKLTAIQTNDKTTTAVPNIEKSDKNTVYIKSTSKAANNIKVVDNKIDKLIDENNRSTKNIISNSNKNTTRISNDNTNVVSTGRAIKISINSTNISTNLQPNYQPDYQSNHQSEFQSSNNSNNFSSYTSVFQTNNQFNYKANYQSTTSSSVTSTSSEESNHPANNSNSYNLSNDLYSRYSSSSSSSNEIEVIVDEVFGKTSRANNYIVIPQIKREINASETIEDTIIISDDSITDTNNDSMTSTIRSNDSIDQTASSNSVLVKSPVNIQTVVEMTIEPSIYSSESSDSFSRYTNSSNQSTSSSNIELSNNLASSSIVNQLDADNNINSTIDRGNEVRQSHSSSGSVTTTLNEIDQIVQRIFSEHSIPIVDNIDRYSQTININDNITATGSSLYSDRSTNIDLSTTNNVANTSMRSLLSEISSNDSVDSIIRELDSKITTPIIYKNQSDDRTDKQIDIQLHKPVDNYLDESLDKQLNDLVDNRITSLLELPNYRNTLVKDYSFDFINSSTTSDMLMSTSISTSNQSFTYTNSNTDITTDFIISDINTTSYQSHSVDNVDSNLSSSRKHSDNNMHSYDSSRHTDSLTSSYQSHISSPIVDNTTSNQDIDLEISTTNNQSQIDRYLDESISNNQNKSPDNSETYYQPGRYIDSNTTSYQSPTRSDTDMNTNTNQTNIYINSATQSDSQQLDRRLDDYISNYQDKYLISSQTQVDRYTESNTASYQINQQNLDNYSDNEDSISDVDDDEDEAFIISEIEEISQLWSKRLYSLSSTNSDINVENKRDDSLNISTQITIQNDSKSDSRSCSKSDSKIYSFNESKLDIHLDKSDDILPDSLSDPLNITSDSILVSNSDIKKINTNIIIQEDNSVDTITNTNDIASNSVIYSQLNSIENNRTISLSANQNNIQTNLDANNNLDQTIDYQLMDRIYNFRNTDSNLNNNTTRNLFNNPDSTVDVQSVSKIIDKDLDSKIDSKIISNKASQQDVVIDDIYNRIKSKVDSSINKIFNEKIIESKVDSSVDSSVDNKADSKIASNSDRYIDNKIVDYRNNDKPFNNHRDIYMSNVTSTKDQFIDLSNRNTIDTTIQLPTNLTNTNYNITTNTSTKPVIRNIYTYPTNQPIVTVERVITSPYPRSTNRSPSTPSSTRSKSPSIASYSISTSKTKTPSSINSYHTNSSNQLSILDESLSSTSSIRSIDSLIVNQEEKIDSNINNILLQSITSTNISQDSITPLHQYNDRTIQSNHSTISSSNNSSINSETSIDVSINQLLNQSTNDDFNISIDSDIEDNSSTIMSNAVQEEIKAMRMKLLSIVKSQSDPLVDDSSLSNQSSNTDISLSIVNIVTTSQESSQNVKNSSLDRSKDASKEFLSVRTDRSTNQNVLSSPIKTNEPFRNILQSSYEHGLNMLGISMNSLEDSTISNQSDSLTDFQIDEITNNTFDSSINIKSKKIYIDESMQSNTTINLPNYPSSPIESSRELTNISLISTSNIQSDSSISKNLTSPSSELTNISLLSTSNLYK